MIAILVEQLLREFRLALRRLAATPMFTAFAIVSIALGLGVTTAIYSTIGALVWSTSSIDDAAHLAVITQQDTGPKRSWRWTISKTDFVVLRSQLHSVSAVAASSPLPGVLNDGAQTSAFFGQAVTGNYFSTVRVPVALGRGIQESDDRPDADPVVVLSHEFWQAKTGGDPTLVGRTVRIDERPFVVVGVVARSFQNGRDLSGQFGIANGEAWIPLAARTPPAKKQSPAATAKQPAPTADTSDERGLTVIARLPAGKAVQNIAAEVATIGAALDRSTPLQGDAVGARPAARSWSALTASAIAHEQAAATTRAGGAVVLLVGLVLVVACTNIANLTLGRGASRQHEFGVRRALGASRGRLVREQCMESVVLAAFGGLFALPIARLGIHQMTTEIPLGNTAVAVHPALDVSTLVAAGSSLLASLVVFGLLPAIQLTRASLRERLAGDAAGAAPSRWKGRGWLIACQVAITTTFMLIAFASARATIADARQDPGFDLSRLAIASVSFGPMHWDTARAQQAIASIDAAARTAPGFTSVALTTGLPLGEGLRVRQLARVLAAEDEFTADAHDPPVRAMTATPSIFRTLGVPILHGRAFDDRDTAGAPGVIVIGESVARRVFGVTDVIGRRVRYLAFEDNTPRSVEIIGIARDTNSRVFDLKVGSVYLPLAQHDVQRVLIVGRASGDPAPMVPAFAGILRQANPDLAVEFASTGPMAMTPDVVLLRLAALVSGALLLLAVILAMVGLYGVLSHVVTRRTREIGVRLALGADPDRVRRMIAGEGLRPVVWGLAFGLLAGVGARVILRATGLARNIAAVDPIALTVAAVTLVAAGLLASYLPARRASMVDPNVALRSL